MRVGITSKLFVAISAACILVAVTMGLAVRWSFEQGFLGYLQRQSHSNSTRLKQELETAWTQHRSWDFARTQATAVATIPELADAGMPPGPSDMNAPHDGPPPDDAPGMNAGNAAQQGPPPGDPGAPPDMRGMPGPGQGPGMGPDMGPQGGRHPPFRVYDVNLQSVLQKGPPPPPDTPREPLTVDGKVIGWLVVAGPEVLFHSADRQFQAQQVRTTWIIVGFAALLAACVAVVLARVLLAPVRRLVLATHRLASGDYSIRVPDTGSDELHDLAADFNRLAISLGNAERSRRNFIADISHELRTPLAVLRGELEAIEDGVRKPNRTTLASLQAEVALLSQLIDDLYELSLADIGELSFEEVRLDVAPIVEAAAESFRDRLADKKIALETDIGEASVVLLGDPYRLTQLMKNLLENALRYTDEGGKVRVAVARHEREIHIDVQDSHPAVPEPLLPHLFDRLFRVDASRSRQSGGAGLGLALCKHIVSQHGGTIDALRSPLGGLWIAVRFATFEAKDD
ncbi:ATP-binding protein [Paraburkholderia sabiae]|uniref:histidine kinase n=1 Tax=Paraburkholderia sabiae TaxID=273251 RepID=A0ABU9QBB3_9BURK|nr:ATP-binding protein [Paraburkholderia sabiae]WJZ71516.1 ATP-binding protein [Paraburkholderia sabiae]CAD6543886.1 Signal transduction histidine-protein kinase BaeS [Paraburkholderia sabiae]